MKAWDKLVTGIEEISILHINVAETLSAERKSVKTAGKEFEAFASERFSKIKTNGNELKTIIDEMEKFRVTYTKQTIEMEAVGARYRASLKDINISKEKQEKIKVEYDKQANIVHEISVAYKKSLHATNEYKNKYYNEILPNALNEIQQQHEKVAVNFCKESIMQFVGNVSSTLPKVQKIWNDQGESINSIDAKIDSNNIITQLKTRLLPPADFLLADTQETFKYKMAQRSASTFEVEEDTNEDMQPKQGRKKAIEKIKSLDKEIVDVEKQRLGIETVMAAYSNNSSALKELLNKKLM
jgi:hypothetical protein